MAYESAERASTEQSEREEEKTRQFEPAQLPQRDIERMRVKPYFDEKKFEAARLTLKAHAEAVKSLEPLDLIPDDEKYSVEALNDNQISDLKSKTSLSRLEDKPTDPQFRYGLYRTHLSLAHGISYQLSCASVLSIDERTGQQKHACPGSAV